MKMIRKMSLDRLVTRIAVIFLVPSILAASIFVGFLLYRYRQDLYRTNISAADVYEQGIVSDMESEKDNVQMLYFSGNAGPQLQYITDEFRRYDIESEVYRMFLENLTIKRNVLGYYLLYDNYEKARYAFTEEKPFEIDIFIKQEIQKEISDMEAFDKWMVVIYEERPYLCYLYGSGGVAIASVLKLPDITVTGDGEEAVNVLYKVSDYISDNEYFQEGFPMNRKGTFMLRDYLVTVRNIQQTDLELVLVFPIQGNRLSIVSVFFVTAVIGAVIAGWITGRKVMHKYLLIPIHKMQSAMNQIAAGDWEQKITYDEAVDEFNSMTDTFNDMIMQIRKLKIEKYEKALQEQKMHLQYLSLQLEPHFVLNCLTSLYALSKQRKHEKLENRIIMISEYFRYELQNDFVLKTLEEEIKFTRNAVAIRADGRGVNVIENIEKDVWTCQVPPMIIETFVENSLKYAEVDDRLTIIISVSKRLYENEEYLDILVKDNGKGYSEEWLSCINKGGMEEEKTSKHIGLLNLKKRLEIIYNNRAVFNCKNYKGAISEVMIPIDEEQKYERIDS